MKISVIVTSILFAFSIAAIPASAQTVKKWVDEDGVTHYSDQKPAGGDAEVKEIEVPDANVTEFESEQTSQRIEKQLRELEQDRKAREAEAKAKEEARALEESIEREPLIVEEKKKKKDRSSKKTPYPIQLPTLPKAPNPLKKQ
ncbi:MAG: DUF4124 domain-containing protein [Gammaproteobacteria bacterium]|nr:DUF4124 domain-containing protein [Gammaproteobacteria bacterium]